MPPEVRIAVRWRRASATAGPIFGRSPSWLIAKAKTALRKKQTAVIATTAAMIGITIGPRIACHVRSWRTWARRSYIAIQIHIAGGTWIAISRQLPNSRRRPLKRSATPPTASASGASMRWRRLRSSTPRTIAASSPSRTARPTAANRSRTSREVTSALDGRSRLAVAGADRGRPDAEDDHHDDQREEDPLRPLVGLVQLPGLLHPD